MGYRLLAADVDGTLAPMGASVSETTVRWISQAFRQGKTVTLATGRLPAAAERFRRLLPGPAPLILGNGAVLMDSSTGKILYERLFNPPDALAAMEWGQSRGPVHAGLDPGGAVSPTPGGLGPGIHPAFPHPAPAIGEPVPGSGSGGI